MAILSTRMREVLIYPWYFCFFSTRLVFNQKTPVTNFLMAVLLFGKFSKIHFIFTIFTEIPRPQKKKKKKSIKYSNSFQRLILSGSMHFNRSPFPRAADTKSHPHARLQSARESSLSACSTSVSKWSQPTLADDNHLVIDHWVLGTIPIYYAYFFLL